MRSSGPQIHAPAGCVIACARMKHVALLRGINLGGKNKLPMKALVALFEEAGCADVVTYIQSGNVVFAASAAAAKKVPEAVEAAIAERFALKVPVVTRTSKEMAEAAAKNPFLAEGVPADQLHLAFLAHEPSAQAVAGLDPERSKGDRFAVAGREVYLHLPNGVARTKLSNAWLDSKLGTVSTVRNWRTVEKLLAMAQE